MIWVLPLIVSVLGAALMVAGLLLVVRSRRRDRPAKLRWAKFQPAAVQPAPVSPIEDMVATKHRIREDEASRWVASWMYITGETDKWAVGTEMRNLAFEAQQRKRAAESAARVRANEERIEAARVAMLRENEERATTRKAS